MESLKIIIICTNFVEFMQHISSPEERISNKMMKFPYSTKPRKCQNKIGR